jgi:hypothetical protein
MKKSNTTHQQENLICYKKVPIKYPVTCFWKKLKNKTCHFFMWGCMRQSNYFFILKWFSAVTWNFAWVKFMSCSIDQLNNILKKSWPKYFKKIIFWKNDQVPKSTQKYRKFCFPPNRNHASRKSIKLWTRNCLLLTFCMPGEWVMIFLNYWNLTCKSNGTKNAAHP